MKIKFNTFRLIIVMILIGLVVVWVFSLPLMFTLGQFFGFEDNSNQDFETSFAEGTGGFTLNLHIYHSSRNTFYIDITFNAYASGNISSLGFKKIYIQFFIETVRDGMLFVGDDGYNYNLYNYSLYNTIFGRVIITLGFNENFTMRGSAEISFSNKGIIQNETIPYEYTYTMPVSGRTIEDNRKITTTLLWVLYVVSLPVILLGIYKTLNLQDQKTRALQEQKRQERDFITYLKKKKEQEDT